MPRTAPRRLRLALLLASLVLVLLVGLVLRGRTAESVTQGTLAGWWRVAAADADPRAGATAPSADGEALARQLSLPYATGVVRPSGRFGVRAWDRERAAPGVNLYVSGHGPEAILMGMDGTVLHRWRLAFEQAFPGRAKSADSTFLRRAALLASGDLVAIYQGGGVVRLDRRSRVVWARPSLPYNDLWVSPDERRVRVIEKTATSRPDVRTGEPLLEDWIVTLDAGDGRVTERASILAALERSPFRTVLEPPGPTADILHTNTIEEIGDPPPPGELWAPGRLLVSLREIDTVALLDPTGETVIWARRGPYSRQHEPSLLPDGRLLLFDNLGAAKDRSRVLAFLPDDVETATLWPPAGVAFFSQQMGSVARLPNGDLLAVESERGAAWEVDPEGKVVWEFRSPHRAGARNELVAVLADLVRLPVSTPFLREVAGPQLP